MALTDQQTNEVAPPTSRFFQDDSRRKTVAKSAKPAKSTKRGRGAWVLGAVLPVTVIVIWQVLAMTGSINTQLFPAPSEVVDDFVTLTLNGVLVENFVVSLLRASVGILWGAGLGLLVGVLVGFSRLSERLLDPTLQMLRTVPLIAVIPLFILWFGFGEESKIILIAVGSFFPIYVNTFLGVRGVDRKLFDVAATLGFSTWQTLKLLVIPAALPSILLGLRLSIGMGWLCLVVAELMGATSGIGYLIQDARSMLNTSTVLVGVIIFAAIGKITDSMVRYLERRLLRWRETYTG